MQVHIRRNRKGNHVTTQCGRYGPKVEYGHEIPLDDSPMLELIPELDPGDEICPHCLLIWRALFTSKEALAATVAEHHIDAKK